MEKQRSLEEIERARAYECWHVAAAYAAARQGIDTKAADDAMRALVAYVRACAGKGA